MEIYSTVGIIVCIVMLVSGYKSFKQPESKLFRMSAWISAATLGIMLFVDSVFGIIPRQVERENLTITRSEAESLAAAMIDTEKFLMGVDGIKAVNFSDDNGNLKITVRVKQTMNDENIRELKDEIYREFLHNLVDEFDDPDDFIFYYEKGHRKINISVLNE